MSKRTIKRLLLNDKVKLIHDIDAKASTKTEIASKYGIPSSTLSIIYKNRDQILKLARAGTDRVRKRIKVEKDQQLNEDVWKWMLSLSGKISTLSGSAIRKRAQELAHKRGCRKFVASVGWLEKFRARHNLKIVRRKIVLPTQASSLPGSVGSEEFILSGNSTDNILQESSTDSSIPDIEIKQEPVENDNGNSASLSSELFAGRRLRSGLSAREKIVPPSFNRTRKNQPANQPSGSAEPVVPMCINETSSEISIPRRNRKTTIPSDPINVTDTAIKQEPDENDNKNSASLSSKRFAGRRNGTSENQPANQPSGSAESVVPTCINETPSEISTPRRNSESANPSGPINVDIVRENGNANLNCCRCHQTADESRNCACKFYEFLTRLQLRSGLFAREEIVRPACNGTSENQPSGSAESVVPTCINVIPSEVSTPICRNERANHSSPTSSNIVHENGNANLTPDLSTCRRQDQLECFGNYIVSRLKLMDTRICVMVQKAINDTIFVAEMESLRA